MIKEALEYIVGLKTPIINEIGGNTYSDKPLNRISYVPYASTIEMKTLTSLVEYIKAKIDCMSEKMIVHVVSPTEVHLYSSLDTDRKRERNYLVWRIIVITSLLKAMFWRCVYRTALTKDRR